MYRLPFTQGVWQAGYETNLIPEWYNHYVCGHVTVFKGACQNKKFWQTHHMVQYYPLGAALQG